ncbi:MAG: cytochrome C [Deltaproteobacteria bacterium HGW-Deltaproteobacteria-15]|nr:MAG: cytochrome C [Deltaproteobacteria bacterium HGW-Deltaproteobacteria-15]
MTTRIKRFSRVDRGFHLALMLTFLAQSATGFGRMFINTPWGKTLCGIFGGYETAAVIHHWVGGIMIAGFLVHCLILLSKVDWRHPLRSVFGPDSLVPNLQDARHLWQRILWFFGLGGAPKLERWAYWEKFDYWAVFWGLPLLAITGIALIYPMWASAFLPGWALNIAALLHRAEAVLAVSYIFIVHFFIGHVRPSSFPMNQAMFAGSVSLEEAIEEKPAWVERLRRKGKLEEVAARPPALWYKVVYFIFGYSALLFGVYLLVFGIIYSPSMRW